MRTLSAYVVVLARNRQYTVFQAGWHRWDEHIHRYAHLLMSHGGILIAPESVDFPLSGVRVIDMGIFWAGPYAGSLLGAMGADVIKVESVHHPDGFRFLNVHPDDGDRYYDRSWLWQSTNLDKRAITLDLRSCKARDIIFRLIAEADILIENFSARVLDQLGISYEVLHELNPGLIVARMPGFGLSGPWRDYVGWAAVFEQLSAQAWVTGWEGSSPLVPGGYADPIVAVHSLVAILAALAHLERTGDGQLIEVSQYEVMVNVTAAQTIEYSLTGVVPGRVGNRSRTLAPQGLYRCADGWIALSVRSDHDWVQLSKAVDQPAWVDDPDVQSVDGRRAAHDAIDRVLNAWCARLDADQVVTRITAHGVPVAAVLNSSKPHYSRQLAARGFYEVMEHPLVGTRLYPRWAMRSPELLPQAHRRPAPMLGQHNYEVLTELGLSAAEIEDLRSEGLIGDCLELS